MRDEIKENENENDMHYIITLDDSLVKKFNNYLNHKYN